jgi:hypothetical protein
MRTIDLSYAVSHPAAFRPPAPIVEAPESAHDALRYATGLAGLSGHGLMDREMKVYQAWVLSMDRRFDRPHEETAALARAMELIEDERAKRDPKYGAYLEEKRAFQQRKSA